MEMELIYQRVYEILIREFSFSNVRSVDNTLSALSSRIKGMENILHFQTCIKRSLLGQRKSGRCEL
jgi:hypothetical protein